MDDQEERHHKQAKSHMEEFIEGLDEINSKIEVLHDWRSVGRSLDSKNTRRSFKNAEALYRMATNVVDNTDYTLDDDERDIMLQTEEHMEHVPSYVEVEFEPYEGL